MMGAAGYSKAGRTATRTVWLGRSGRAGLAAVGVAVQERPAVSPTSVSSCSAIPQLLATLIEAAWRYQRRGCPRYLSAEYLDHTLLRGRPPPFIAAVGEIGAHALYEHSKAQGGVMIRCGRH
eukprot:6203685-Pleurochrysis_carterae.AAC.7